MFDLVNAVRNLCTIMLQIEKDLKELIKHENDLKELIKQGKPEEKTNGGTKK